MQMSNERWRDSSPSERLAMLQNLEYREANSQGRAPAKIISQDMNQNENGLYDGSNININSQLLNSDAPDEALSTYFHEERHAQQHNDARFPELSDNPEQAREWQNNFNNYISPEEDFRGYWNQPVESDAREYASNRMSEFKSQNQNQNDRPEHYESFAETNGKNLWQYGNEDSRLKRLQDAENYNAEINGRPAYTIEAQNMPDQLSSFDPEKHSIAINEGTLSSKSPDMAYDSYYKGLDKAAEYERSHSQPEPHNENAQARSQPQGRSESENQNQNYGYGL